MENFISEGSSYYLGVYGNFEPAPFFIVGLFRLAVLSTMSTLASFTVKNSSGINSFNLSGEHVEISMSSLQNVITDRGVGNKAILVRSETDRFSIIAYDEEFTSADAYKTLACVRLPIEQYYEYYAVSVPAARIPVEIVDYGDYEVDDSIEPIRGNSVFLIITCEADTELNITLTQDVSSNGSNHNITTSIKLSNVGSTLLFSSEDDLSGSRITSNRPLTLISGHQCGSVPSNKNYCDHMAEQVPPTATWGTQFLTAPIDGRRGFDVFKVIAAEDNTMVEFFCNPGSTRDVLTLSKGAFANISVDFTLYCFVSSNRPVLLVQFAIGSSVDNMFAGDPFMVIIPPIDQYKSSYNIWMFRNSDSFPENFYVNLLVPEGTDATDILMNGMRLASDISFNPIRSGSQFRGQAAQVKISNGLYNFTHVNSSSTFNLIAYWASFRSGSGYFGGMTQKPITSKLSSNEK